MAFGVDKLPSPGVVVSDVGKNFIADHDPPVSSGEFKEKLAGWDEDLQEALSEKDSLLAASVQVLSKRLQEAEKRNQQLEALVTSKDERIMKLVDIIIHKMGGFDAG